MSNADPTSQVVGEAPLGPDTLALAGSTEGGAARLSDDAVGERDEEEPPGSNIDRSIDLSAVSLGVLHGDLQAALPFRQRHRSGKGAIVGDMQRLRVRPHAVPRLGPSREAELGAGEHGSLRRQGHAQARDAVHDHDVTPFIRMVENPNDQIGHAKRAQRIANHQGDAVLTEVQGDFSAEFSVPRDRNHDAVDFDPIPGIGLSGDLDMGGGLFPRRRSKPGHLWRAAGGPVRSRRHARRRPSEGDPHLATGLEDLEAWEPNERAGGPPLPVAQGNGQRVAWGQRHRAGKSSRGIDGNRETANAR